MKMKDLMIKSQSSNSLCHKDHSYQGWIIREMKLQSLIYKAANTMATSITSQPFLYGKVRTDDYQLTTTKG